MSGYSYETMVGMVGKERADELFAKHNVPKIMGRKSKNPTDSANREYIKLSETAHGKLLHQYLNSIKIKHTHIGNESGQAGTKNIIIMMAKKKALGTSSGFPDYVISIPTRNSFITLYIELKKALGVSGGLNGSECSDEQKEWRSQVVSTIASFHSFAHGSEDAIKVVDHYISKFKDLSDTEAFDQWIEYKNNPVNIVESPFFNELNS